jgi:ketosteroid isomerase-like protein
MTAATKETSFAQTVERNKAIVKAFYDGGVRGDITGFSKFLHKHFVCSAPNYLPWGGETRSADGYLTVVLPQVAAYLDFRRFSYESLIAEGDRVVALINVGVVGTQEIIQISEHWHLKDGVALSIWVAYYEPRALLEAIASKGPSKTTH